MFPGEEREFWLRFLLAAPAESGHRVANHGLLLVARVEVERDVLVHLRVGAQVDAESVGNRFTHAVSVFGGCVAIEYRPQISVCLDWIANWRLTSRN